MTKKLSVIIPSFNSQKTIGCTLEALGRQTRSDLVSDVIVVDSSNDGATQHLLQSFASGKTRIINAGVRVMPAVGRNLGAREASGDLLAFIDSDAYMRDDWVEKIMGHYANGRLLGGGAILPPPGQFWKFIPMAQYFLQFNEFMDAGASRRVPFLPSCNLFCDRMLFEKTGGFPSLRAAEDVLFCLKAKPAEVWFIPEAKVHHIFREALLPFLRNQELLGRYVLVYRRLHEKKFYYHGAWPLFLLPAFLMIKLVGITSRVFLQTPRQIPVFILVFPVFLVGLAAWAWGFARAAFGKGGSA